MSDETKDPMRELEHDSIPTPEEALEALGRYNNSHFRGRLGDDGEAETARYSIPANHKRDDDLRLSAFVRWAARQAREVDRLTHERDFLSGQVERLGAICPTCPTPRAGLRGAAEAEEGP